MRKRLYGPADVAELVDALGLGSSAARRGGASPLIRTIISLTANALRVPPRGRRAIAGAQSGAVAVRDDCCFVTGHNAQA